MQNRIGGILLGVAMLVLPALSGLVGCASTTPEQERFGRAKIYHMDGRYYDAIAEYKEVLTLKPDESPEVYFNLALIYEELGDKEKAKENYQKAIEEYDTTQQVKKSEAHQALGALYFTEEQFTLARSQFELARTANASDPRIHFNIGHTLLVIDPSRTDEIIDAYETALGYDPDFAEAHLALAWVLLDLGNIEKAQYHHTQARQNGRDDEQLVLRFDFWDDWIKQEVNARIRRGTQRDEYKVEVFRPRAWNVGSATRAGTTIVNSYEDTAAILIGERAAVQVIGPDGTNEFSDIPADTTPIEWAKASLIDWMRREAPDAYEAYQAQMEAAAAEAEMAEDDGMDGDEMGGDDMGNNGDDMTDEMASEFNFRGDDGQLRENAYSYADGTTGFEISASFMSMSGNGQGVRRELRFYYYLGEGASYVLACTQDAGDGDMNMNRRSGYTLDRIVNNFREIVLVSN